jgi:hypothetical protein
MELAGSRQSESACLEKVDPKKVAARVETVSRSALRKSLEKQMLRFRSA